MILVDTSAWIETFHINPTFNLTDVIDFDDVVTCLPILQEVLQGFRDERAFRKAREAMLALPMVGAPIGPEPVLEAVNLYRSARRAGITVRSSVDCLIAAFAIRHDLLVLHVDRDFPALARISPLREQSIRTLH
jgi:predicted nucleic acid-binding protein